MDKKIVGVNAGKIWHVLNEVDGISIPELARKVNLSEKARLWQSVGWHVKTKCLLNARMDW